MEQMPFIHELAAKRISLFQFYVDFELQLVLCVCVYFMILLCQT